MGLEKYKIRHSHTIGKNKISFSANYQPDLTRSGFNYSYEYNLETKEFSSNICNGSVSDAEADYLMKIIKIHYKHLL